MKIISIERLPGGALPDPPLLTLYPDTAVVRQSTPLFLPDFTDSWEGTVYVAVRISRLGKGIAPKFAGRYYDAYTLVLRALPSALSARLADAHTTATALASCFDYCVAPGEWTEGPVPDRLAVSCGEESVALTSAGIGADAAISAISRYMTLRTGDIIMACRLPLSLQLVPDRPVDAEADGRRILHVKLK